MQICIMSPGFAWLALPEKSISSDGWARAESFSLVRPQQGQKKQTVCDKLWPTNLAPWNQTVNPKLSSRRLKLKEDSTRPTEE